MYHGGIRASHPLKFHTPISLGLYIILTLLFRVPCFVGLLDYHVMTTLDAIVLDLITLLSLNDLYYNRTLPSL
jgi:hypothetical protein